ncbi:cbb3-type cytochrome c oxidase subunit I [Microaerobacter geothermalis]|uniref:cbb3-type cytochrome c oxidase subunit I n=1 Tax=Microaerobacter geothermalis TaxID=674972 RepID=UPI001F18F6CE|nr:cbb3-type cytochrome c oxidase subunit I [Microaerobacter geothermalis]MCF6092683.1 cbb3-type cytochrome c oxidase subunit I [Microaerobacter geothermalis]
MFSKAENSAAKNFWYSSIFWLIISMLAGLVVAIKQINPNFLGGVPWLSYGRIRPIHTNGVLFAWLSMTYIAALFYMIPKLLRTPLWSERMGNITCFLWNILIILAVITLASGITTGVEYAELILPLDIYVAVGVAMVAINVFMTIAKREEKQLYVSIWYFVGSLLWLPLVYVVGNVPSQLIGGAPQANMNWFYGHNAIGLWFTTVGIGQIYYLLPKLTGKPLYSHKLSLIGFWTIATFYVWNGPHHLVNAPIPVWLMKAGIIPSILLIIPVWTVLANVVGTMKGAWHKVSEDVGLKFIITGSIFYLLACLQGPFQSLMTVSAVVKYTQWVVGHAHMAPFAAFSFVSFAAIYYAIPRITGRQLYSKSLQNWHYWFSLLGFIIFAFSLWIAGIIQGFSWINGDPFTESLVVIKPLLVARAVGGTMMILAQFFFAYNIFKTVTTGARLETKKSMAA